MSDKVYPKITAVDDNDQLIGYYDLVEALDLGLRRRVSAALIFDNQGRVLVQRRSATVLSPNLLDFSASGHVNEGDDYLSAIRNELNEELCIKETILIELVNPLSIPGFYCQVFTLNTSKDTEFVIDPNEVSEVFWLPLNEYDELITKEPEKFTKPLVAIWQIIRDKIMI